MPSALLLLVATLQLQCTTAGASSVDPPRPPASAQASPRAASASTPACSHFEQYRPEPLRGRAVRRLTESPANSTIALLRGGFDGGVGLLEPGKPAVISVLSTNVARALVRSVPMSSAELVSALPKLASEAHWGAPERGWYGQRTPETNVRVELTSLGLPVAERTMELPVPPAGQEATAGLDLNQLMTAADGAVWVELSADGGARARRLYQVTDLGLLAWTWARSAVVQAVRLSDGRPWQGVALALLGDDGKPAALGRTDANGLISLEDMRPTEPGSRILVAQSPDRRWTGVLQLPLPDAPDELREKRPGDSLRAGEEVVGYVRTERDLYAPGDEIHFVAWVALGSPFESSGFRAVSTESRATVALERQGKVVAETSATPDRNGKLWGSLRIPQDAASSRHDYVLSVRIQPKSHEGGDPPHQPEVDRVPIGVSSFSPSGMSLQLRTFKQHLLVGEPIEGELVAEHRSGGRAALSRADASLWCNELHQFADALHVASGRLHSQRRDVTLNAIGGSLSTGRLRFSVAVGNEAPLVAHRCTLSISAYDGSFRGEAAETQFDVHPARYSLSLEAQQAHTGAPLHFLVKALTWDGRPTSVRTVHVLMRGGPGDQILRESTIELVRNQPRRVTWPAVPAGKYRLEASGVDGPRSVRATLPVLVSSRHCARAAFELRAPDQVEAGSPVIVDVRAPSFVARGLLLVRRNGVRAKYPLRFDRGHARAVVPTRKEWFSEVELEATAVWASKRRPPVVLRDTLKVELSSRVRALRVSVAAPQSARPGQSIDAAITVRDGQGRIPHGARVSVWVVDEGVLALTGYSAGHGLGPLSAPERIDTEFAETLSQVVQPHGWRELDDGATACADVLAGAATTRPHQPEPRTRFETTPYFAGDLPLDSRGEARARFTLPHNLTTFRITAIASAPLPGGQAPVAFGIDERTVQTSLPLLIKPVMPSRLRPGDEVDTIAVVQNRSAYAGSLEVSVEPLGGRDALVPSGPTEHDTTLGAGDEARVITRFRAAHEGEARVRWRARLRADGRVLHEDAIELPVRVSGDTPVRERIAHSGLLAANEVRSLSLPLPERSRLEQAELGVRLTASLAGEAEAAMQDLLDYPYGCIEQTLSRLVPFVAAPSIARRLSGRSSDEQLDAAVRRLEQFKLGSREGVGYWPKLKPELFATAWTTLVLAAAKRASLLTDERLLQDARAGLQVVLADASADSPAEVTSLAMFALAETGGELPAAWLARIRAGERSLSAFAIAFAAMAIARTRPQDPLPRQMLERLLLRLESEQASTQPPEVTAGSPLPAYSAITTRAAVLWAFGRVWPDAPVVDSLVAGLLSARAGLAWPTTFDNSLALLSLSSLGLLQDKPALGSAAFELAARSLLPPTPLDVTGRPLLRTWPLGGASTVLLQGRDRLTTTLRAGPEGPIAYTVFLSHAPLEPDRASSAGLRVVTSLRSRFGRLGRMEPLPIGEVFAIDLSLRSERRLDHVAVEIPLAAGAEPFDVTLGSNRTLLPTALTPERQLDVVAEELHPDRILVFVRRLEPGLPKRYTVYARAAVPGSYAFPGARAEVMYVPAVRGRAAARKLVVSTAEH